METYTTELLNTCDTNIKILDISHKNIEGVLDLDKFTNLEELYCDCNKLTTLQQ